jgi:HemY protein
VLDARCAASDWAGALAALEHMKSALDKRIYRRRRAVLLTARAQALEELDRRASLSAALEAVKLAPDLVPAAALAGRALSEAGEPRKARRLLEKAWAISPHPDLAEAYANLRLGDSARERLARMQKLAEKVPGQLEGALAVAHAALDAREFAIARAALASYVSAPTRRVATLMAEIEELEHGDEGRVREWLSRAMRASGDPMWTADGVVSDHWMPVAPNGQLDGFAWRIPLAEIEASHPLIDTTPAPDVPASEAHAPVPAESQERKLVEAATLGPEILPEAETTHARPAKSADASPNAQFAKKAAAKPAAPVLPLIRLPDDPGPDSNVEGEDNAGATSPGGAWHRFR